MAKVTYHVVAHDDGFAYRLGAVYSEAFATHADAVRAARQAAGAQQLADGDAEISWQDEAGNWHHEHADGADRPETTVVDDVDDVR